MILPYMSLLPKTPWHFKKPESRGGVKPLCTMGKSSFFVLESEGSCPYCSSVPRPQKCWFCVSKSVLDVSTFSKFKSVPCQTVRPHVLSMKIFKNLSSDFKNVPDLRIKVSPTGEVFRKCPSNFKSVPDPWTFAKVSPAHAIFQKCPQCKKTLKTR